MAIYHLSAKVISRSNGRSATSAAAYRSGEKIYDERQGRFFYFPEKDKNVVFSEIMAPANAAEWLRDRERLWNAVEQMEKRKDSQLAKEIEIALPKELSLAENVVLLKEYVKEQFVENGLVADVNIHDQDRGNENVHAHIMLTMRRVVDGQFDVKKARDLNKKDILHKWREEWANKVNHHLALNGHNLHIDHRSYKEQGIELVPQNKRGPEFTRKRLLEKTEEHKEIARQNGERIYANPQLALAALTYQQSTFTRQDIARFVNRHSVDAEQFTRVFERVCNALELVILGVDQKGQARYSTREMVRLEQEAVNTAKALVERSSHDVSNPDHGNLATLAVRAVNKIEEVFTGEEKKLLTYENLSEEQKLAVEHITQGGDLACVLGYAGTGKSYMLGAARELWEERGYRVRGLSLTGVAARGLEDGSGIESQTIARQFRSWGGDRDILSGRDIIVVDEAGMVASRESSYILGQVKEAGAKLVIVGDFNQLPPIGAGSVVRAIMEEVGYVELTEVRRQTELWQQEATKRLARGEIGEAVDSYTQKGFVHAGNEQVSAQDQMLEKWAKNLIEQPGKTQIMVAYTNEEVKQLNFQARDLATELGILGNEEYEVDVAKGKLKIAEHEKIFFLKNNYDLDVMNGTLGEVSAINQNSMSVILNKGKDTQREVTVDFNQYNHFTYGYAATVHKLQGATFDDVQVLVSNYFNRNIGYVAFTRHKYELNIYHSFKTDEELVNALSRSSSKDTTLDYPYIGQQIVRYDDVQTLGDLGYLAFHNRELIEELELVGEKKVSFITGKLESGLVSGLVTYRGGQYLVLEQEQEFKLYNQKSFGSQSTQELTGNIGCLVKVAKNWEEEQGGFRVKIDNTGLCLLEDGRRVFHGEHVSSIFVLGQGVLGIQNDIATLEERYNKAVTLPRDGLPNDIYGVYRGLAQVRDREYGVLETKEELRLFKEPLVAMEKDSWVKMETNSGVIPVAMEAVPREYIFELERLSELGKIGDKSFIINTPLYESGHLPRGEYKKTEFYDVVKVREELEDRTELVVEQLLGSPNKNLSSSMQWRYGNKGSLAVGIAGDKRGLWYDFESGDSGDLLKLIQQKTGLGFPEALRYASNMLGGNPRMLSSRNEGAKRGGHKLVTTTNDRWKTQKYAEQLARESQPIAGTVVEKYLKEMRGIKDLNLVDIRYHPGVYIGKGEAEKYMPAMLAIGRDREQRVQCVQATYLDPQTATKADLATKKRTYASPIEAPVLLRASDNQEGISKVTYIAEGVETGLSIRDAVGERDVLVTLGKTNFASIDPERVGSHVVFCLDNDGKRVFYDKQVHESAGRLVGYGKEVYIALPQQIEKDGQEQKTDFNDIAKIYGVTAVRGLLNEAVPYREWQRALEIEPQTKEQGVQEQEKVVEIFIAEPVTQYIHEITPKVEAQEKAIDNSVKERSVKERVEIIIAEATRLISAINYSEAKQDEFTRKENRASLIACLQANCGRDKEVLNYLRDNSPELFREINRVCGNVLRNTLKSIESQERLLSLVGENRELYDQVLAMESGYQAKEKSYKAAMAKVTEIFTVTGNVAELAACREARDEAAEAWKAYAKEISNDVEVTQVISQHNSELFKEMNGSFNNMFIETIRKNEIQEEYIRSHPEFFANTMSQEERISRVYERYQELKQGYIDATDRVTHIFTVSGDLDNLQESRAARDEAKVALDNYANEICCDREFMNHLEKNDPKEFNAVSERFNEVMREQMQELQKETEREL
jgi:Ti-type conjugative transfer relaxase TraA